MILPTLSTNVYHLPFRSNKNDLNTCSLHSGVHFPREILCDRDQRHDRKLMLPFSQGTLHESADNLAQPAAKPRYLPGMFGVDNTAFAFCAETKVALLGHYIHSA